MSFITLTPDGHTSIMTKGKCVTVCALERRGESSHRTAICLEALHHGLHSYGPLPHPLFPSDVPFYAHVHSTVYRHYPIFEYILIKSSGNRFCEFCNSCQCVLVSSLVVNPCVCRCTTNLVSLWLYIGANIGNPHTYSIVELIPIPILANSLHQSCAWILAWIDSKWRDRRDADRLFPSIDLATRQELRPEASGLSHCADQTPRCKAEADDSARVGEATSCDVYHARVIPSLMLERCRYDR